ncbi:tRNA (adenosine(37)-N6)-threonylcarbamoyltransferase complex ATPase subunit type 1 TsaE [bacterium]|nr:tRNA (adenosine(37)-N6)-threonylcarbamoyltransferase complex ATPase subunit type 1 TsaE [bacterium]
MIADLGTIKNENESITNSPEETIDLGIKLGTGLQGGDVVALYGKLGAGKTTFVKGICELLKTEPPSSPSYVIINNYVGRENVFHIDLYRINSDEELYDLGLEEYLYSDSVCLVEWAEKAKSILPEKRIEVYFEVVSRETRKIKILKYS